MRLITLAIVVLSLSAVLVPVAYAASSPAPGGSITIQDYSVSPAIYNKTSPDVAIHYKIVSSSTPGPECDIRVFFEGLSGPPMFFRTEYPGIHTIFWDGTVSGSPAPSGTYEVKLSATAHAYEYALKWGGSGSGDRSFHSPRGIALDQGGNVYVADMENNRIQKFDANGAYITQWGTGPGRANGSFVDPVDLDVSRDGYVYVVDSGNDRIQKFDSNGGFVKWWGGTGTANGKFENPSAITVDYDGNVYVAEIGNHRVQKFDKNGNFIKKWGGFGTGDIQFDTPVGIAASRFNDIYVADAKNRRIQVFDSDGNFKLQWDRYGTSSGDILSPGDISVRKDASDVYVTDTSQHCVFKFSKDGEFQVKFGREGGGNGEFRSPRGITVRGFQDVYVTDDEIDRVQKFSYYTSEDQATVNITIDRVLPSTAIHLKGDQDSSGAYTPNVLCNFTASDDTGGMGAKYTEYSLDGSQWLRYGDSFWLNDPGPVTVYYRSVDNAGNVEDTKSEALTIAGSGVASSGASADPTGTPSATVAPSSTAVPSGSPRSEPSAGPSPSLNATVSLPTSTQGPSSWMSWPLLAALAVLVVTAGAGAWYMLGKKK